MMSSVRCGRVSCLILVAAVIVGCTAKRDDGQYSDGGVARKAGSMANAPNSGAGRLLVRTASIEVTVPDVGSAMEAVVEIADQAGGYVDSSSIAKGGGASLTLRIPADRMMPVLGQVGGLGVEQRRSVSAEDVTDRVVDLEAELANQRALRDRLRALLARAKDVKDVLAIETELTRVQTQVDSLEGQLKETRQDIALSAIDVELKSAAPPEQGRILGPLGLLYEGTKWFVIKLFVIREASPE